MFSFQWPLPPSWAELETVPLISLQPQVKNIIVLFQKTTIPIPRNVLRNLEVGGDLKIQSFKIFQGVGWGEVSQPHPTPQKNLPWKRNGQFLQWNTTLMTQNNESNFQKKILFHSQYFNFTCTRNLWINK